MSKRLQAIENSRRFKSRNQFNYASVDCRVYNAEKDLTKPLSMRKKHIIGERHNDRVSAKQLYNIEVFCGEAPVKWNNDVRSRIVEEYGLHFDEKSRLYTTDERERVLIILQQKYTKAKSYEKYSALLYAMRYGETPCEIYYEDTK